MLKFSFPQISSNPLSSELLKNLEKKLEQVTKLSGEIEVLYVDRTESQSYNQKYAHNDYPTDVLSFNYQETSSGPTPGQLGTIIICLPIAKDQALEHHTELTAEVALLITHGSLHIAGLDHQNQQNQTGFAKIQNDIIDSLQLPSREFFDG